MSKTVKDEIVEQIERLDAPQQRKVLDFARRLSADGTPGSDLLRFVGCIDPGELSVISQAIEEGCEKIEPNGW